MQNFQHFEFSINVIKKARRVEIYCVILFATQTFLHSPFDRSVEMIFYGEQASRDDAGVEKFFFCKNR